MISDESGLKLFDRKFVAAQLRLLLHCPKCKNDYTDQYYRSDSDTEATKNRRPILLACGHSLCETCVKQYRQNLICSICNSPARPTIKAKDPNSKYAFRARDYYELNFHMLGEVSSLRYYRRYSEDSVNKSLLVNSMSEIVLLDKCSECAVLDPKGECKQCNALYCTRCFNDVHRHSKALKMHNFQSLRHDRRLGNEIRVGNYTFLMPTVEICKAHNLASNIYCSNCKRSCCKQCLGMFHASHKTRSLLEINMCYTTHIPENINAINAKLLNIRNGQQLVKNTKQKLNDYAKQSMDNITKWFHQQHGQLQNAELAIMEQLREDSLPTQMRLNSTMNQLNSYETVLLRMRQLLECGSGAQVPRDIWLKTFTRMLFENLERMPTDTEVATKLDGNPFVFSSKSDGATFAQLLQRHLYYEFIDPEIAVKLSNEFDANNPDISTTTADLSVSLASNNGVRRKSGQRKPQKHRQTSAKSSKSKTVPASISLAASDHQEEAVVQHFSALDISKNQSLSTAKAKNQSLSLGHWFQSDIEVKLSGVKSPEDFYLQSPSELTLVRKKLDDFANTGACRSPKSILVGHQYLTYHTDYDRWHRALVNQQLSQHDVYNVFLPDSGIHFQVHSSNFRELPADLATLPFAAVHCTLKQLMPSDGGAEWGKQASAFLKQIVQQASNNNTVHVVVLRTLSPQFFEVDLITVNNNTNISVRESFLYSGLARPRTGSASGLTAGSLGTIQTPQLRALQSQRLRKFEPQLGEMIRIQMLHVEQPHEFYAMPYTSEPLSQRMQQQLNRAMEGTVLSQLEPIFLGRLQMCCVVQLNGEWQRARIEEILPEGFVVVRLVDWGTSHKLWWDQLFVLPRNFWQWEELSLKCCLADVETLQQHGYLWTEAAIADFQQLTSNPNLYMEVIGVRDGAIYASLTFARAGRENPNVAALLVAQGHCTSSGDSSKVILPRAPRQDVVDVNLMQLIYSMEQPESQPLAVASAAKPTQPPEPRGGAADKRVPVVLLYAQNPFEFYVTVPDFEAGIAELMTKVQLVAQHKNKSGVLNRKWSAGENCFVKTRALEDNEPRWYRGVVLAVDGDGSYSVQLRDVGETILDVPSSCLTEMDLQINRVANGALRCQLFGILPKTGDGPWSPDAIDFFKAQLRGYSGLAVTGRGRKQDVLNVTLWGTHTEISGPFSPARVKYVNINEMLVLGGFAMKDEEDGQGQATPELEAKTEPTLMLDMDDSSLQQCFETVDRISAGAMAFGGLDQAAAALSFEHSEDMPDMELLEDLNSETPTTGWSKAPEAWLIPRPCGKFIFTAKPTYVNHNCEVFLTLDTDQPYIKHMRKMLNKCYSPMLEQNKNQQKASSTAYVKGQPVVVVYHLDNLMCRGIIDKRVTRVAYDVYFVDYGNTEVVGVEHLLPYAPFPQLHAMTWRVVIDGIEPKGGDKYSIIDLDTVHKWLVLQLTSVRVIEPGDDKGKLAACELKVADSNIATLMVDSGMAQHVAEKKQPKKLQPLVKYRQKEAAPPECDFFERFKMFDELQQIGSFFEMTDESKVTAQPPRMAELKPDTPMPSPQNEILDRFISGEKLLIDQTDSSAKPPPPKKKFTPNWNELRRLECAQDIDCREAAKSPAQPSIEFESDSDEEDSESADENEPMPADEEWLMPSALSDIAAKERSVLSPLFPSQNESVHDQLKLRVLRRHKEITDSISFTPLDTSTERSYFDGIQLFKPQSLPRGVNHFYCTVDSVLSATELQISPRLSEFTKQTIRLANETRVLIDMAPPLSPVELKSLCLALYSKDQQWYRATIKEVNESAQQAVVFYIDFHNTETVAYEHLKAMPKELFVFPLRSFRARLHGVKLNKNFDDKYVRQALQNCLCKYQSIFARVYYPSNYHDEEQDSFEREFHSSSDSIRNGFKLIEVDLYETPSKKERLYEHLIDAWQYLKM